MKDQTVNNSLNAPLNSDRPKERLADDRLGYAGFARAVARSIQSVSSADGIVMAIHGPWGSGKTSAVNMIVDALSESTCGQSINVVRFNPWWFSQQEDLTRAFFSEVSAALGPLVSAQVREGFRSFAKRLGSARKFIGSGVAFLPGGAGLKELLESGLEALSGLAEDDIGLDQARTDLRRALVQDSRRILVIIDDVDRLPDDEARQIFRMVKSVADLPNVIYLLVFDREVARSALRSPTSPAGPEWLEKIVQVSFDLPSVYTSDLTNLFTDGLNSIIGPNAKVDQVRWPNLFHRGISPWLRTPRDVARALNAVATTWPVVGGEVDMADLVALEVLRTFEPTAYDYVRRGARELTGVNPDRDNRNNIYYDELVASFAEPHRSHGRDALQELFPRLMSVWGNMYYDSSSVGEWDKGLRVAAPRRFPAYFTYGIGPDVFSQPGLDEIMGLMASVREFEARIHELSTEIRSSGDSRAAIVLEELQHDPEKAGDADSAVSTLLEMGDVFIPSSDGEGARVTIPMSWRLIWVVDTQLRRLPRMQRFKLIKSAVETSPSLLIVGAIVDDIVEEHDPESKRPVAENDRLVGLGQARQLQAALAKRLKRESLKETFVSHPKLLTHLYRWGRASGFDHVKAWTKRQMAEDDRVLALAGAFTTYANVRRWDDTASRREPRIHIDSLVEIVDLDLLKKKIGNLGKRDDLNENQRAIIADFERGLSSTRF